MSGELATQLDVGAVYDRDPSDLTSAFNAVLDAFGRRTKGLAQPRRR